MGKRHQQQWLLPPEKPLLFKLVLAVYCPNGGGTGAPFGVDR